MASACVNNIGVSPDSFLDCPAAYPWLNPRISFGRDHSDESKLTGSKPPAPPVPEDNPTGPSDPDPDPEVFGPDFGGFEFRLLEDPVTMLPADELFSDGKLMPLQLSMIRPPVTATSEIGSPETMKSHRRSDVSSLPDPYLFSPKAPRCSSRWKELLGLKKLYLNANAKHHQDSNRMASSSLASHSCHNNSKSFKNFLHRKSSIDSSLSLPLLKDSDIETICMSSRLSLSSSSSGHEHDDLPRLSLDSEKPNMCPKNPNPNPNSNNNPPRVRLVRHRTLSSENTTARVGRSPIRRAPPDQTTAAAAAARGVSVDSPRMNSSGKIVFQGLERSSSSPSSLNGGPRFKHRGMERSYSANVRVTPVLNVPVCSLRGSSKSSSVFGFQLFSSQQKRDGGGGNGTGNRGQQSSNMRNRTVDHRA